ncbi:MAG: hypothetical protein ACYC7J_17390 [Syntrophales bacterium]
MSWTFDRSLDRIVLLEITKNIMFANHRKGSYSRFHFLFWICLAVLGIFPQRQAHAIPSFARQTGLSCASCHTVFPSLTTFGRQFKLRSYTLGTALEDKPFPENLPLAVGLQLADTLVADGKNGADPESDFPRSNEVIVQQLALYFGGRIFGKLGAFGQYNWDGIEKKWGAEMVDIRYADGATAGGKELLYGVSVSNSPSVQDIWNTSPMWSFPHLDTAGIMPMQTSLMDMTLANQVGGVGIYGFYNSQFYGEIGFFRNGKEGIFKPLNLGDELATALDGNALHLRIAWEKDWGSHSFEIGAHFLRADIFPDPNNHSGPTDRFTDVALDSQYQYDGGDHLFSLHAFFDHEKRSWDASFPAGEASNPSDNLNTFKLSGHYWYKRKLGGGIGIFDYRGDTDIAKYGMGGTGMTPSAMNNATGSPDTRGWIVEADWLPSRTART